MGLITSTTSLEEWAAVHQAAEAEAYAGESQLLHERPELPDGQLGPGMPGEPGSVEARRMGKDWVKMRLLLRD